MDAADKEWHLTSPTPYDPPLTYGGWTQCRALGARIASILLAREAAYLDEVALSKSKNTATTSGGHTPVTKPVRKKHRIVIHTSPFLRCTQTSIAVAAGMSQFHGMQNEFRAHQKSEQPQSRPQTRTPENEQGVLETISNDGHAIVNPAPLQNLPIRPFLKAKLRLDAFLGEWFSPEYYEQITHPPSSILMLASAKAELLHRGEALEGVLDPEDTSSTPKFFPGGWGSPVTQPGTPVIAPMDKDLQLPELERLTFSGSPTRERATTFDSTVGQRRSSPAISKVSTGYTAPTSRYAILPLHPIPRGYTAHARDACIDVDYAWDSTRPPICWGDGGEYGEEWSSMHKRFRSGISRMIHWYRIHHESPLQSNGHKKALHPVHEEDNDEGCKVDTILILVTHGAGCNALIGALTGQPVLMDVAMASLTMAVRKDTMLQPDDLPHSATSPRSSNTSPSFRSPDGTPLSQEYSVVITASVDHLRAGTNPLSIPILQNPSLAYESLFTTYHKAPYINLPKYKINHSSMITSSPIDQPTHDVPLAAGLRYGGVPRSASEVIHSPGVDSSGLWHVPDSRHTTEDTSISKHPVDGPNARRKNGPTTGHASLSRIDSGQALNLTNQESQTLVASSSSTKQPPILAPTTTPGLWPAREDGNLVKSSPGLWSARIISDIPSGPPNSIPLEVSERSPALKRRWTVNENN